MIGKGSRHALHHSSFFAEIHTTFREHHQNILGPKSSPFLDTSTVRSATDVLIDRPTLESNEHRQRMPIPNTHSMMMLNSGTTGIVSFPGAMYRKRTTLLQCPELQFTVVLGFLDTERSATDIISLAEHCEISHARYF
jgi:hypothetical protein